MTEEERLVKTIVGRGKAGRLDSRIFAYAIETAGRLLFNEGLTIYDIRVTKSVYPEAGRRCGKSRLAAERQIERISNLCWDMMDMEQREKYFGESERCLSPKEIIVYLAYYCRFQKSYREVEAELEESSDEGQGTAEGALRLKGGT